MFVRGPAALTAVRQPDFGQFLLDVRRSHTALGPHRTRLATRGFTLRVSTVLINPSRPSRGVLMPLLSTVTLMSDLVQNQ